jgi:hypothetical protein
MDSNRLPGPTFFIPCGTYMLFFPQQNLQQMNFRFKHDAGKMVHPLLNLMHQGGDIGR